MHPQRNHSIARTLLKDSTLGEILENLGGQMFRENKEDFRIDKKKTLGIFLIQMWTTSQVFERQSTFKK